MSGPLEESIVPPGVVSDDSDAPVFTIVVTPDEKENKPVFNENILLNGNAGLDQDQEDNEYNKKKKKYRLKINPLDEKIDRVRKISSNLSPPNFTREDSARGDGEAGGGRLRKKSMQTIAHSLNQVVFHNKIDEPDDENEDHDVKVRDLFLKSEIHGFPEWYEARDWAGKIIWTLIVIVAIAMLIQQLFEVIHEWKENPILTTYSVMYDAEGMVFPKIYICPMTPIHEQNKLRLNISRKWEVENNVSQIFESSNFAKGEKGGLLSQKFTLWDQVDGDIGNEQDSCWRYNKDKGDFRWIPEYTPTDIQDYFMKAGYPVDLFFMECAFQAQSFPCSDYVTGVFDKDYGKCFLLDLKGLRQSTAGLGLALVLNMDTENAYSSDNPPFFDGLVLRIGHDEFQMVNRRKAQLSPERYTMVELEATKYNLIQQIRTEGASQLCVDPENAKRLLHVLHVGYSIESCRLDCILDAVINHCGCLLPMDKRYLKGSVWSKMGKSDGEDPFCHFSRTLTCAYPTIKGLSRKNQDYAECYQSCKPPCEFWEYKTSMSLSRFPSTKFINKGVARKKRAAVPEVGQKKRKAKARRRRKREETEYRDDDYDDDYDYDDDDDDDDNNGGGDTQSDDMQSDVDNMKLYCEKKLAEKEEVTYQDYQDYVIVDISFAELQYMEISQENSITFTSVMSDFGGQFGLWLGLSIVTGVKFFIIAVPLIWKGTYGKVKKIFGSKDTPEEESK